MHQFKPTYPYAVFKQYTIIVNQISINAYAQFLVYAALTLSDFSKFRHCRSTAPCWKQQNLHSH